MVSILVSSVKNYIKVVVVWDRHSHLAVASRWPFGWMVEIATSGWRPPRDDGMDAGALIAMTLHPVTASLRRRRGSLRDRHDLLA